MICVARVAAIQQQKATEHYKDQPLGILTTAESQELIDIIDRIQILENSLSDFLKCRGDTELELEAEGLRKESEGFEKRNRKTSSMKEFIPTGYVQGSIKEINESITEH